MAKKVKIILKVQVPAGQANPAPPIGTALGPQGVNIQDFCKQFNDATKEMAGDIIPAEISVYEDRSFTFVLKSPPAAALLKKASGLDKGSSNPLKNKVGRVTRQQIKEIAQKKIVDLNANDLEAAENIIAGTARSIGIEIKD